jgi:hypothetical protein
MALEKDSNVIETVVQLLSQQDGLAHAAEGSSHLAEMRPWR